MARESKKTFFENAITLLFVVIMFLIFGTLAPSFLVSITPAEHYYSIQSPAVTDKLQYKAGEFMTLRADRNSEITIHADSVQELVLTSLDGGKTEVFYSSHKIPLLEGDTDVAMRIQLPENIEAGTYFWHGVIFFEVKGVEKNYAWSSSTFEVIK